MKTNTYNNQDFCAIERINGTLKDKKAGDNMSQNKTENKIVSLIKTIKEKEHVLQYLLLTKEFNNIDEATLLKQEIESLNNLLKDTVRDDVYSLHELKPVLIYLLSKIEDKKRSFIFFSSKFCYNSDTIDIALKELKQSRYDFWYMFALSKYSQLTNTTLLADVIRRKERFSCISDKDACFFQKLFNFNEKKSRCLYCGKNH